MPSSDHSAADRPDQVLDSDRSGAEHEQTLVALEDALHQLEVLSAERGRIMEELVRQRNECDRLATDLSRGEHRIQHLNRELDQFRRAAARGDQVASATQEELQVVIEELQVTAEELEETNQLLRRANEELERRVAERTTDLERSNTELRNAVADRDVLLREVHHRVKNNMQVIASLLRLQSRTTPEQTRHGFRESLARIQSMSLVHELLYQSANVACIDFGQYLRTLVKQMMILYQIPPDQVQVEVVADVCLVDLDTATPLALIVGEAVSNALKHAFPHGRKGTIWIALEGNGACRKLIVRDDGIGMPGEKAEHRGLGMVLIPMLARQIDAQVSVTSGSGLTVTITLPESGKAADLPRDDTSLGDTHL
jgi:two-component sensor histidine kinase